MEYSGTPFFMPIRQPYRLLASPEAYLYHTRFTKLFITYYEILFVPQLWNERCTAVKRTLHSRETNVLRLWNDKENTMNDYRYAATLPFL